MPVVWSGLEKLKNMGEFEVIDLIGSRVKNAEKSLTTKLESMPEDVFASMIGKHMLAAHVAMASATPTTTTPNPTTVATEKSDK